MDSRELSEWIAFHRYFMPLPDSWQQTGIIASCSLAPYSKKNRQPKASDFVPIEKPPQHVLQDQNVWLQLKAQSRSE